MNNSIITLTPYSNTDYDPIDILDATLSFPHGNRRIERIPLINGGNYIHDFGFYESDRTATITGEVTRESARNLDKWMAEDDFYVYFVNNEGIYKAQISQMDISNGIVSIQLFALTAETKTADIPYWEPAVAEWNDVTSDSYWTNDTGGDFSWDGSKWAAEDLDTDGYIGLNLATTGSWSTTANQFSHMRLTYSTSTALADKMEVFDTTDTNLTNFFSIGNPTSGVAFPLSGPGGGSEILKRLTKSNYPSSVDILAFPVGWTFEITKIEVYGILS